MYALPPFMDFVFNAETITLVCVIAGEVTILRGNIFRKQNKNIMLAFNDINYLLSGVSG